MNLGRLNIARFTNASPGQASKWVPNIERLGVRCSLPGWLQRLEWTERKDNYMASFAAYQNDLGLRAALIDDGLIVIVDGWVYEVIPDGLHVHYIASGAWKRHFDRLDTTTYAVTDTIDAVIESALAFVPAVSTDYSNVLGSTTTLGATYNTDELTGTTPGELIEELIAWSNSSDQVYDYWVQSYRNLRGGTQLLLPFAQLQTRAYDTTNAWDLRRENLRNDPRLGRNIYDLATRTTIYYTPSTLANGAVAQGGTVITVDDETPFSVGDTVSIQLGSPASGRWQSSNVWAVSSSPKTITLESRLSDAIADNAIVRRTDPLEPTATDTDSAAETSYWRVDYAEKRPEMKGSSGAQYRDARASIYNNPIAQHAFTVTSKTARVYGIDAPTYMMLRRPFYFRILDMDPTLSTPSVDGFRSFLSTAIDYDGQSLRIVPDTEDARLDVLLKRAGIMHGEMVGRGGAS